MRPITVLIAEDDPDDREFLADALAESPPAKDLRFVDDGEELMDYLRRPGNDGPRDGSPRPRLVILDLKMPRKSGWEALEEIKADPALRTIPVVVLSTSNAPLDTARCLELGASAYITKPATFQDWLEVTRTLEQYWPDLDELSEATDGSNG